MYKWNVSLRSHSVIVTITPNTLAKTFVGQITSAEYGKTQIANCKIDEHGRFIGEASLNGISFTINAAIDAKGQLEGTVHHWPVTEAFTGTKTQ